uniref:Uncharacterized protein n=1 Tax=Sinocyclocheilus grahami TaxID=75366 RepID=A0A672SGY1_SINGR
PLSGSSSRDGSRGASSGQGSSSSFSWPWSSEPDPCLPGMGHSQRLITFGTCIFFSALCFELSALYAPLLLLKARKFALMWSLGSVFALLGATAVKLVCLGTESIQTPLNFSLFVILQPFIVISTRGVIIWQGDENGHNTGMRFVGGTAASAIKRTVTSKAMPV